MTAPPSQNPEIRDKWRLWLDRVKHDVLMASLERHLWKEVTTAITREVPTSPATFSDHYTRLYVHSQAMAVRRLMLHRNTDRRSLASLIVDLKRQPFVVTRTIYVEAHLEAPSDGHWRKLAAEHFDRLFGDGGESLSLEKLDSDLTTIKSVCGNISDYADNTVAHIGEQKVRVTFAELDSAIDLTEAMFKRYALLLTASDWILPPAIQDNWKASFSRPLFPTRWHDG